MSRTKSAAPSIKRSAAPTPEQFAAYQGMYDFFNRELFTGQLPAVLLNFSRKTPRTLGFFAPQRWDRGDEVAHEISLNPTTLKYRRPIDVASTLVHEMVHLWQQEYGNPSRTGYHNRQWAEKMEEVGLVPSHTGEPGGRRVGQQMTHYIAERGAFDRAFQRLPPACALPWACSDDEIKRKKRRARNKVKYTCTCGVNIWGKPKLKVICAECGETFESEAGDDDEG